MEFTLLGNHKTVAIAQARYDSTRLFGKVLLGINDMPAIEWVVRAARAIPQIDEVVIATSNEQNDDIIVDWCKENGVKFFRGSKSDVLNRFYSAAEEFDADIVMRLTCDCPFLDPAICSQLLTDMKQNNADYATNSHPGTWPDGLDCEAMKFSTLKLANEEAKLPSEREHVTRWIRANKHRFKQTVLCCPLGNMHEHRWTLDNEDDARLLQAIAAKLPASRPPQFHEILHIIESNPEIAKLGSNETRNASLLASLKSDFEFMSNSKRIYSKSVEALTAAQKVIPMGSQTFSKSKLIMPKNNAPLFLSHGLGARVWDVDGNEYVDLVSALLPVILGYCDPDVDYAIRHQMPFGFIHSLSTTLETELANLIINHVPSAEMVRFGKNGTDATSAAIRIARAFTNKTHIAVGGYHGWQDWYIGSTVRNKGVPSQVSDLTHSFNAQDPDSLRKILEANPKKFAAIILEPLSILDQTVEKLTEIKDLSKEFGAVLIFDEICSGFRVDLGGAQKLFGVVPDLTCLGKAVANGMPLSIITGRADIMGEFENVFVSGTFAGETLSIAAAIATINKLEKCNVPHVINIKGGKLRAGVNNLIERSNLSDYIKIAGHNSWQFINILPHSNGTAIEMRTFMMRKLLDFGALIIASHNISYAFSEANEAITLLAYEFALGELSSALAKGPLLDSLDCEVMQPVFSVRNTK
jgi:glutamate-1-semialdehyde 2,1-aminomutase